LWAAQPVIEGIDIIEGIFIIDIDKDICLACAYPAIVRIAKMGWG
jgi:hypothetical protein